MKAPALLYVEDNLDDRVLFDMACKQADAQFRLFSVEHGKEAVDYLSGSGRYANRSEFPLPDGVLLDLKMPFSMDLASCDGSEVTTVLQVCRCLFSVRPIKKLTSNAPMSSKRQRSSPNRPNSKL